MISIIWAFVPPCQVNGAVSSFSVVLRFRARLSPCDPLPSRCILRWIFVSGCTLAGALRHLSPFFYHQGTIAILQDRWLVRALISFLDRDFFVFCHFGILAFCSRRFALFLWSSGRDERRRETIGGHDQVSSRHLESGARLTLDRFASRCFPLLASLQGHDLRPRFPAARGARVSHVALALLSSLGSTTTSPTPPLDVPTRPFPSGSIGRFKREAFPVLGPVEPARSRVTIGIPPPSPTFWTWTSPSEGGFGVQKGCLVTR